MEIGTKTGPNSDHVRWSDSIYNPGLNKQIWADCGDEVAGVFGLKDCSGSKLFDDRNCDIIPREAYKEACTSLNAYSFSDLATWGWP
jgi:hypothetical protein